MMGAASRRGTLFLRVVLPAVCTVLVASALSGCTTASEKPIELKGVEVRQYQGEDLSSVADFRENSIKGPQYVDRETYRLEVSGKVEKPLELTYDQVLDGRERFEKVVTLDCVEGWSVDILWEGVKVQDILDAAGADPDASTIIFRAFDGYSTSLPAAFIRDHDLIMAYKINGVELPAERGFPFQLVAEDKWGYKWIKWIVSIEVSEDSSYKGYWEQRGYSNDGALDKGFLE